MKKFVSELINGFTELFLPRYCLCCQEKLLLEEHDLCLNCLYHLPRTNFHTYRNNPVMELFLGRIPLEMATSYFFFRKGSVYQELIHQLKYKGHKELGSFLGEKFGNELSRDGCFNQVDFIIPVPLHPRKLRKRGYNQSEWIAMGLSKALGIPVVTDAVVRKQYTETQTKKDHFARWENVSNVFALNHSDQLKGKTILLVDDVVTTGATLEACATAFLSIPGIKINIATLAIATL